MLSISISLFSVPVLIHQLGASQYGILLIIASVTGLLGVMNFGLGEATLRYVAHHYGDNDLAGVNRVFGSTLSFYVAVSAVCTALVVVGAPQLAGWLNIPAAQRQLVADLLRVAVLVFSIGLVGRAFAVVPAALQRYDISSKVTVAFNIVRTAGLIALALSGFGLMPLVVWDLAANLVLMGLSVVVARRLLPGLSLLPSASFSGLREILGYSMFSFLTWWFHTMHRESGKLLLTRFVGTAPVSYLGAPDNVAQRIHMVVASGAEVLVSRFSANRDEQAARGLFWNGTWFATALSLIFLIPFFVLVPDLLRLWISPEFARASGIAGQLLALYLVSQGAFAPVASYFRGIGKPWFVSVIILLALVITVATGVYLIPRYGVTGAAYAYLAGSAAPFLGVVLGGFYAFGSAAVSPLLKKFAVPLLTGSLACCIGLLLRGRFGELNWFGLVTGAACLASMTAAFIVGGDWLLAGTDSSSRQTMQKLAAHPKLAALSRLIPIRPAA